MKKIYLILTILFFTGTAFAQGTFLLKDVAAGEADAFPSNLVATDNVLIYKGADSGKNLEIVVSDGTEAGTYFYDVLPGTYVNSLNGLTYDKSSGMRYPVLYKGKAYFNLKYYFDAPAVGAPDSREAFFTIDESNGLSADRLDTVRVFDGLTPNVYANYGDTLLFSSNTGDREIYMWDGVNAPEVLPNQLDSIDSRGTFVVLGDKLIIWGALYANKSVTGDELLTYDIKTGAIDTLGDLTAGSKGSSYSTAKIAVLGDKCYFIQNSKLWETNGTAAGTQQVITEGSYLNDTNQVYDNLFAWKDKLYFSGKDMMDGGSKTVYDVQLYVYDPAAGEVTRITSIEKEGEEGTAFAHYPKCFASFNDHLYYVGRNGTNSYHLFETDGVTSTPISSTIYADDETPVVFKDKLYFVGEKADGSTGTEVFVFDPLLSSVSSLADSNKRAFEVYPNPSNGYVYVKGINDTNAAYSIYSISGSIVKSGNIQFNRIDYNLNPGSFILQINDTDAVKSQKFLVR
ncbi:T9SS type A sorting domain-containing protein [Maribellus sediminis]|uniref:T9SS type A sorting domain-containing protein n=1 Tax=Maribellus sediminis TaxID=2696285 RepID=UPI0014311B8D|nr:T9SS type A sorting domain-containing protein [Maribellus sediminis]